MTDTPDSLASPCVMVCTLDERDICLGCLRSLTEIGRWGSANDLERATILANVASRTRRRQSAGD